MTPFMLALQFRSFLHSNCFPANKTHWFSVYLRKTKLSNLVALKFFLIAYHLWVLYTVTHVQPCSDNKNVHQWSST